MGNIPLKMGERGRSVNYFANLGAECHFPKIECNESNFSKKKKKKSVSVIYLINFHRI
jgi:hypothetical protein